MLTVGGGSSESLKGAQPSALGEPKYVSCHSERHRPQQVKTKPLGQLSLSFGFVLQMRWSASLYILTKLKDLKDAGLSLVILVYGLHLKSTLWGRWDGSVVNVLATESENLSSVSRITWWTPENCPPLFGTGVMRHLWHLYAIPLHIHTCNKIYSLI